MVSVSPGWMLPIPPRPVRATSYDRSGLFTPSLERDAVLQYIPTNVKDPLDMEVARCALPPPRDFALELTQFAGVNGFAHGLLIERVDPPLRGAPKDGEEVRAQYAFSNQLGRKAVTCKLTTMNRSGGKGTTRKVMCRVGGGECGQVLRRHDMA